MNSNKLTPGANLMWESSRMMLPEHKKQIQAQRRALHTHNKPLLDEQEQAYQFQILDTAFKCQLLIEITIFNPYQNQRLQGKIKKVNSNEQILHLQTASQLNTIHFSKILNVTYIEDLPETHP